MIIKPKYRGFICTTAHPLGCEKNVEDQIRFIKGKGMGKGPKSALIIGGSAGYGLSAWITAAYGFGAATVGVFLEKPGTDQKTGTAGWYNARALKNFAEKDGLKTVSINGDGFSEETKREAIERIRGLLPGGKVDLIVYSLAAPKRVGADGRIYNSVIKPAGEAFTGKTVDFHTGAVTDITVGPASRSEIEETVKVMGGEDWELWARALAGAGALADGVKTVAFSYIGPELTHGIYKDGAIGAAKLDLEKKAEEINKQLAPLHGEAFVSINKAVVTQASAAIPVVPLYMSILFRVMKEKGVHEGCAEQMDRLLREGLYGGSLHTDPAGRIRLDDLEMARDVQAEVAERWGRVSTENVHELTDLKGFREDFFKLFGFGRDDVDYGADVDLSAWS